MYPYLRYVSQPAVGDAVGVVVAQGEIVDGDARKGTIGARAAAELIQRAREDDDIKALVVRIDSPGGSAFASELIREQLDLTRKAGKPVVVSMGDVAASGGYWIAMGGDEVIADAATITGSIGVFALIPNFAGTMEKIGVNTAGVGTTWIADATDLTRPLDKRLAQVVESRHRPHLPRVSRRRRGQPQVHGGEDQRSRAGPRLDRRRRPRSAVWSMASAGSTRRSSRPRVAPGLADRFRVEYVEPEPRGLDRYLSLFFGQLGAALRDDLGWDGLARTLTDVAAAAGPAGAVASARGEGPSDAGARRTAFAMCAESIASVRRPRAAQFGRS